MTARPYAMSSHQIAKRRRELLISLAVTLGALILLGVYLMPLGYGVISSLKTKSQVSDPQGPLLPSITVEYEYEGEKYGVYYVPTENGQQEWALVRKGRNNSGFVDIHNPEAGVIEWEGNWRQLEPVREVSVEWNNYPEAWNTIEFPRLLGNTLVYAFITMIGTLVASALVAYGIG